MQSEAMIEEPARGRHQGRATRQEDALNLFGCQAGIGQGIVRRCDPRELRGDPASNSGRLIAASRTKSA